MVGLPDVHDDEGSHCGGVLDEMEDGAAGLLRHRVVPPSGFGGRLPQQFFADANQFVVDDELSGGIGSGTYFTDLITNGLSPSGQSINLTPLDEVVPTAEAPAPARGTQKRSKKFSNEEDKLLVSAWLNVSMDSVNGVDQSRTTYWKRIYDYFRKHKTFNSDRSQVSFMNHWSVIQHDVNIFVGHLSKIDARNSSGMSVDDKQANACVLFKAEDKQHRNFPYMHCWKILKGQLKWMDKRMQIESQKSGNKKQKVMTNLSPISNAPTSDTVNADGSQQPNNFLGRPAGKKKEK